MQSNNEKKECFCNCHNPNQTTVPLGCIIGICQFCHKEGMQKPRHSQNEGKKCDYCSREVDELRCTPFLADIGVSKNGMCRNCWNIQDTNEIGEFDHCQPQNEAKVIVRQDVMHDFQISIDETRILFEAVLFRMNQSASSTTTATLLRENDMQISLLTRLEKILTPSHDNP